MWWFYVVGECYQGKFVTLQNNDFTKYHFENNILEIPYCGIVKNQNIDITDFIFQERFGPATNLLFDWFGLCCWKLFDSRKISVLDCFTKYSTFVLLHDMGKKVSFNKKNFITRKKGTKKRKLSIFFCLTRKREF